MTKMLAVLLLPAAALAAAPSPEWVNYGESEIGVHYYDPSTVKAEGARKRVWRLIDRKEKLGSGIQSGKALIEIDCKAGTYRYLKTMQYGGHMGQGKFLGGDGEQPPEYVAPGTMVGYLSKLVCDS